MMRPIYRESGRALADQREGQEFDTRLAQAESIEDLSAILAKGPLPRAPGRARYDNLAYFIMHLTPPPEATAQELRQLVGLVDRLDRAGTFTRGVRDRLIYALNKRAAEIARSH